MADVSDVVETLATLVSGFLYPNGTNAPSSVATPCQIEPGWPVPAQLQANKNAGVCTVSVYPWPGERNTTRYLKKQIVTAVQAPTLAISASGLTATLSGSIPPLSNPHVVMIFANGEPYAYAVQPTDTIPSICAALVNLIGPSVPFTYTTGNSIVLPPGNRLGACQVGTTGTATTEIRRQEKQFRIIVWGSSPKMRSQVAKLIDPLLAAMTFITLPDETGGRIRYVGNTETDNAEKMGIYRRDLIYTVEYPTIQTIVAPQVLAIGSTYQTPTGQPIDQVWTPDQLAPSSGGIIGGVLGNDQGTEILGTDSGGLLGPG